MTLKNRALENTDGKMEYAFSKGKPTILSHIQSVIFTKRQFLDSNKFKALADDKLNVAKILISVFNRVENIVG